MDDVVFLILMMVGGVCLFATAFLPGNHIALRIFCGFAGPVLVIWMLWVLLFGGTYIVNLFVVALPFILVAQGIRGMIQSRRQGPHAQDHGEAAHYGPQGPYGPPEHYAPPMQGGHGGQYGPPQQYGPPAQAPYPPPQHGYARQAPYPPQQQGYQPGWPPQQPPQQPPQGPPPGQHWPGQHR